MRRPPPTPVRYTFDLGGTDKRQNLYKELNVDMRQLMTQTADVHKNLVSTWAPLVKNILMGMARMPKHVQRYFYRGRPENYMDLRELYAGGREITWAAFTSCSKSLDQAMP